MEHRIKTKILIIITTLIICLAWHTTAHSNLYPPNTPLPVLISADPVSTYTEHYIYETISVPGVDFLEVTASNDFGDYAGNTQSLDGKKTIGFTLIDGVFVTYDFPGSQRTQFYALSNNGVAAGHYKGSDGLYHGVVLDENGELKQYDFAGAVETFIFGISDETGTLSGNIVDTDGVFHGFSGDMVITFPGAVKTYADFINAAGVVVGSYVAADGTIHGFMRDSDGTFTTIDVPEMPDLEFLFVNAINNVGVVIFRAKAVNDIQRSYISLPDGITHELRFPGSVSTVVRNINQDGSIIGYYDSADGRRHGFLGIPVDKAVSDHFGNIFNVTLTKGLNMVSVPLVSPKPMTAKSLAGLTGATVVIALDAENQSFVGWTPSAPNDGFAIEGGQGYIVNVPQARDFAFVGAGWTNPRPPSAAAPTPNITAHEAWAFVVSGQLDGTQKYDGYHITVRNTRTNTIMTTQVSDNYFAAATADLTYRSVVQVGDTLEVTVSDTSGNVTSESYIFTVTPDNLANALLSVQLDSIGQPNRDQLLQNYPNPFNPETWIPYQLSVASPVSISIFDATGGLVRTLNIGYQSEGFYHNRGNAAYWDGRNALGERVASGVYFYRLETSSFQQTRRMIILK